MFNTKPERRLLCLVLSLSLVFQSMAAAAPREPQAPNATQSLVSESSPSPAPPKYPTHVPAFEGQSFEGLNYFDHKDHPEKDEWEQFLREAISFSDKSDTQKVLESGDDLTQLMIQYSDLYARARWHVEKAIAGLSLKDTIEFFEKNRTYSVDIDGLKAVEFRLVPYKEGYELVGRVKHEKSGVAFILFDESVIEPKDTLNGFLADQWYNSARGRIEKYRDENDKTHTIRTGRDLILIGVTRDGTIKPKSVQLAPRERNLRTWWKGTHTESVGAYEGGVGILSGTVQAVSSGLLVSGLSHFVNKVLGNPGYIEQTSSFSVAAYTFLFGATLGVWTNAFHKWRQRGTQQMQDYKNMGVALTYYLGVFLMTSSGQHLSINLYDNSFDSFNVLGMIELAKENWQALVAAAYPVIHFAANFWINNQAKGIGYGISDVLEEAGKDTGKRFFLKNRDWNRQFLYYLPNNWTKLTDQVWFALTLGPTISGNFPLWYPLAFTGIYGLLLMLGNREFHSWAYNNYPQAADKIKVSERTNKYFTIDKKLSAIKQSCSQLLSRFKSKDK